MHCIPKYVTFYFVPLYDIFSIKHHWCDLEIWVMGRSVSLKIALIDRSRTIYYWSGIVSKYSSILYRFRTKYRDLEI